MTDNFKEECKNYAYKNRLGKVIYNNKEITNSDYLSQIEIVDSCSSNNSIIGTIVSTQTKFSTLNSYELMDKDVEVQVGVKYDDNTTEYISLGQTKISSEDIDDTGKGGSYTGYDVLNRLKDVYKCGIANLANATIKDFWLDACSQAGLETDTNTFTNSTIVIGGNPFTNNETIENVMQEVAKAGCYWVEITRDGKVNLNWFNDTVVETFTKDDYISLTKNNVYGPVNTLVIGLKDAEGENVTKDDASSIAINGEIQLAIYDSYFLSSESLRKQAITGIWEKVHGLTYTNFELTSKVGKPYITRGNKIAIEDIDGNIFYSYALSHTFTYDGTFISELSATSISNGETTIKNTQESATAKYKKTELMIDKVNGKISTVIEQTIDTTNPNSAVSKVNSLSITVGELEAKIKEVSDITTSGETSYASLDLTGVNASEPIHVKIFPVNKNISYQYPYSTLYPSSSTYLTTRTIRFYNKTTEETFDYVLPDNLYYYDSDTYDEFNLDHDTQTCQVIKRCGINADGTISKLSSAITTDYDYPSIDLSDGDYTISLLGYSTGYLFVRLMASNIYTTQFATRVELESSISQSKSEIETEVSEKYYDKDESDEAIATVNSRITQTASTITESVKQVSDDVDTVEAKVELKVDKDDNDQVVSMINASADQITLNSNRLVVNSTQFQLDASGNATFGGSISAASISGSTMTGSTITGNTISGGSISITTGSYYFNMGVSTSHPNCSGLNVGSGGINFKDNDVGLNSSSGTITAGATFQAANFKQTGTSDNILLGNLVFNTAGKGIRVNKINPNGELAITTGGATADPSSNGIYIRTGGGHITLDATNNGANTSRFVYAWGGTISNSKVKTDAGSSSSRNTKENIVKFKNDDYKEALDLLKNIDIYSYTYKYNLYENRNQYGFIIDEIQEQSNANKFFDFSEQKASVDGDKLDFSNADEAEKTITVKKYNTDTLDKYLLTCIKALQEKVDKLESKYE